VHEFDLEWADVDLLARGVVVVLGLLEDVLVIDEVLYDV
jgi:hypothetical protein